MGVVSGDNYMSRRSVRWTETGKEEIRSETGRDLTR